METTVRSALVTAWRRASAPTSRFPFFAMATTDGVSRYPERLGMTTGVPDCTVATTELVVPRSIPITGSTGSSHALQQSACLLVIWMLGEDQRQLVTRLGLEAELDERLAEQEPRFRFAVGSDLARLGREGARLLHFA